MKTSIIKRFRHYLYIPMLGTVFALLSLSVAFGQQAKSRVYATGTTAVTGSVSNIDDAKDEDVTTAATITVNLLGLVVTSSARVEFADPVTNKAVHVKLGAGTNLLAVAPTITIQAYLGNSTVGAAQSLGGLVSLLGGTNTYEYIFTPSTTLTYDRIRVTFTAISVGTATIKFYDAYYEEAATGTIACDQYVDVLSGSTGTLVSGLTTTVQNPLQAVNGNLGDAATLNGAVSALNSTYLEVLYPGTSLAGDSVRILVEKPSGLLELGLLDAITVTTLNGADQVDLQDDPSLLRLQILPSTNKYWISFKTSGSFDRIRVSLGGAVSALSSLLIYEIQRVVGPPTLTASNVTIYSGHATDLTATPNGADGVVWTPGSATSFTINTGILTADASYDVVATRGGCSNVSAVTTAKVTVLPLPTYTDPTSVIEGKAYIASSGKAIILAGGQGGSTYTFTIGATALPTGLLLGTDGKITGTPGVGTGTGVPVNFTADVFDVTLNQPVVTGQTFSITVYPPIKLIGGAFPATDKTQTSYTADLKFLFGPATGGLGAGYQYFLSPQLPGGRVAATLDVPTGFVLSTDGILTGNPNGQPGTFTFSVYANDGQQETNAEFTLFVAESPLPVTLVTFKAAKEGASALLSWSTTSEANSDRFDLERSSAGKEWVIIGTKASNGESAQLRNYSLNDANPLNGENLYRLKMIDLDGTFAYSKIESLNFSIANASVHPNPVTGSENIQISIDDWNKVKSVRVVSQTGKVVFESNNALSTGINTGNLSAGLYVVQVVKINGTISSYKVVKQ